MTQFNPSVFDMSLPISILLERYGQFTESLFSNTFLKGHTATVKDKEIEVSGDIITGDDKLMSKLHTIHCVLGYIGEFDELSQVNLNPQENVLENKDFIEELGDISFYLIEYLRHNSITLDDGAGWASVADSQPMKLIDAIKRYCYYNNDDYEIEIKRQMSRNAQFFFYGFLTNYDRNPNILIPVLKHNYAKLSARYPNKVFSSEHAAARLDKNETDDNPTPTASKLYIPN